MEGIDLQCREATRRIRFWTWEAKVRLGLTEETEISRINYILSFKDEGRAT